MAHRTRPPSRGGIAEQTIDFIENLGYPLVPWQAEMLRNMLKHDGPVEVSPPPRKHDHQCPCHNVEPLIDCNWRCGLCGALHEPKPKPMPGQVRVMRDGEWVWETPDYKLIQKRWEAQGAGDRGNPMGED